MSVIELRDAELCVVESTAVRNEDGEYESFEERLGKPYPCRAQYRTGGHVKAQWSVRDDGENETYTYKVFMDEIPSEIAEGCRVEITFRDGKKERLRVTGIKVLQLSNQIWLSI